MSKRIGVLDGLRGIAVLGVIAHHTSEPFAASDEATVVFYEFVKALWIGVDLFFVISGYLITRILLQTKSEPQYFKTFYARRILRLWPVYYGFLVLTLIIMPTIGFRLYETNQDMLKLLWTMRHSVFFWFYASNFLTAFFEWPIRIVAHFWSLAIEEQFYVVWPAFARFIDERVLVAMLSFLIAFGIYLRAWHLAIGALSHQIYVLPYTRWDSIIVGCILGIIVERVGISRSFNWLSVSWLSIAAGFAILFVINGNHPSLDLAIWKPSAQTFGYFAVAIICLGIVIYALLAKQDERLAQILTHPTALKFGQYSYAIYVFHLGLDDLARRAQIPQTLVELFPWTPALGWLVYVVPFSACCLWLGGLSWNLMEKHAFKLKPRYKRAAVLA